MIRRARPTLIATAVTIAVAVAGSVQAADGSGGLFDDWEIYGTNTLRADHFDVRGPGAQSPYPFEGPMIYDELGLGLERRDRDYARWRAQIFGVLNANRYRSLDDDFVPERLNLTREVGDSAVPYRVEVGDYFSYLSYMTQQRSLKGVQIELQPRFGRRVDSFILFAGANEPQWQDLTFGDDYSGGASYLLNTEALGHWNFSAVYNHRSGRAAIGTLDRDQVVASAGVERNLRVGSEIWILEGEYAHFDGDHDGVTTSVDGQERTGKGYFIEMTGLSDALPLDYRLRGERYTKHFRPRGGVISADRRSAEMHAGWRFDSGLRLRGRWQLFDDLFQSLRRELETRVGGVNLSGAMLPGIAPNLYGVVDVYLQTRDDETRTIDLTSWNLTADFTQPLPADWFGRLGLFLQNVDDQSVFNADNDTWQVAVAADHALAFGGYTGSISPGFLLRFVRDRFSRSDEFQPTLALRLGRDGHSLGVNYGVLMQDRFDTGTVDVATHTLAADYRYTRGRHAWGAEFNYFGFHPEPGRNTDAWQLGLYWTVQFDKPRARPLASGAQLASAGGTTRADLIDLAPGIAFGASRDALAKLGLSGASAQGGLQVYEVPLLREIPQRQRLVLGHSADQVDFSALVIDFDPAGGVDSIAQTFERVRKALLDRYGTPSFALEEGEFGPNLVVDVNAQRLTRVMEWQTPAGVLRFGLPRRIDGRVRMEVQHRRSFPPPRDTLWSVEGLR